MKIEKGMYDDMSNDDYHAQQEPENHYYSSSQLKEMVKDPEVFHKMYITKELVKKITTATQVAFDIGNYYHISVLEPHLVEKEIAIYEGGVRKGKKWDEFKEEHKGKAILTPTDKAKGDLLIEGTQDSPIAMDLLKGADFELSLFTELCGVKTKVRFDIIKLGRDHSYIADLKSTRGNVKDEFSIAKKITDIGYDLSAALYVDAINKHIVDNKLDVAPVTDFYWIFASKDNGGCKTYPASTQLLDVGRAKYKKALSLLKKHELADWQFYDEMAEEIRSPSWEADQWIKPEQEQQKIEIVTGIDCL